MLTATIEHSSTSFFFLPRAFGAAAFAEALAEILAAHLPAPSSLGGIPDRPQGGVPTTGLGRGLPRWPSWADVQTANGVLGQNRLDIDVHHALSSWPSKKKVQTYPAGTKLHKSHSSYI
jgi:hypothetical protein